MEQPRGKKIEGQDRSVVRLLSCVLLTIKTSHVLFWTRFKDNNNTSALLNTVFGPITDIDNSSYNIIISQAIDLTIVACFYSYNTYFSKC